MSSLPKRPTQRRRAATIPRTIDETNPRPVGAREEDGAGGPVRQCAVTRERLEQERMLRFVRSPDGLVVPDLASKLPGRGTWLTATAETVSEAIERKVFSRSFKADCKPVPDMVSLIERQLADRCIGLLGFARKAGHVVIGFDQVRAALRKRRPGWVLTASDSSEDSRNKVHFLAQALYEDVRIAGALNSAELGMAFGRPSVVHALIEQAPVAEAFAMAYQRLIGFRPAPESDWLAEGRTGK